MGNIDLDSLITANPRAEILIAGDGVNVKAFIISELKISGGNSYNNPLSSNQQESIDKTAGAAQALIGSAAAKFGYTDLPSFSLRTVGQSVNTWTGSERPVFSIDVLFVALRADDDVMLPVKALYKAVFPTFSDEGNGSVIIPPMKYLPQGKTARGTVAVKIGTWFQATNLLIKSVSFTFSKETLPTGKLLYASGSINFEPYRVLSYDEINGWFK